MKLETKFLFLVIIFFISFVFCGDTTFFNNVLSEVEKRAKGEYLQAGKKILDEINKNSIYKITPKEMIELVKNYTSLVDEIDFEKTFLKLKQSFAAQFLIFDSLKTTKVTNKTLPGLSFSQPAKRCSEVSQRLELFKVNRTNGLFWSQPTAESSIREIFCEVNLGGWEKIGVIPKNYSIKNDILEVSVNTDNLLVDSIYSKKENFAFRSLIDYQVKKKKNNFAIKIVSHNLTLAKGQTKVYYLKPQPYDTECSLLLFFQKKCSKNPMFFVNTNDVSEKDLVNFWDFRTLYDLKNKGWDELTGDGADIYLL